MGENLKNLGALVMVLLVIAIPLLAPGAFILLGAIGWSAYYAYVGITALSFDPLKHLPEVHSTSAAAVIGGFFLLTLIGAIRGGVGLAAMLAVWGPLLLLPYYQASLGVGAVQEGGWRAYRDLRWTPTPCAPDGRGRRLDCVLYVPRPGFNLPSFEETTGMGPTRIWPAHTRP